MNSPWDNITIKKIDDDYNNVNSYDGNVHLIYILKGSVVIGNEYETIELHAPGFMILPKLGSYKVVLSGAVVYDIGLSYSFNKKNSEVNYSYEFIGNSHIKGGQFNDSLYFNLDKLLSLYYLEKDTTSPAIVFETYFSILTILENKYYREVKVRRGSRNVASRVEEVKQYIDSNYEKEIKLKDLAKRFFVSEQYLSRTFSELVGVPLSEYLVDLRLSKVKQELIQTDKSITSIVYDAGFSNVNSFNRIFKNRFGTSPTYFRKMNQNKEEPSSTSEPTNLDEQLLPLLNHTEKVSTEETIRLNCQNSSDFQVADGIINMGAAANLLDARYRRQLETCKDISVLKYLRISDIMSKNLVTRTNGQLIFTVLDQVIHFILEEGYQPFIVLNPPQLDEKSSLGQTHYSLSAWIKDIVQICEHYLSLYGSSVIKKWKFELVQPHFRYLYARGEITSLFKGENEQLDISRMAEYIVYCERVIKAIRQKDRNLSIGIGGLPLKEFIESADETTLGSMQSMDFAFICFTSLPYLSRESTSNGRAAIVKQSKEDYLYKLTNRVQILLKENNLEKSIYLTEFNITSFTNDRINDTSFKGTYIFKNHLDLSSQYNGIGYWYFSDLIDMSSNETVKEFIGAPGLMTKNGLPKIGLYAYVFLDSVEEKLIFKNQTFLVTKNSTTDSITIVACGYTPVDSSYFNWYESDDATNDAHIFSNYYATKTVIQLENLPINSREYQLTTRKIGYFEGNALDEVMKVTTSEQLTPSVLDYLHKRSEPRLYMKSIPVTDNAIELSIKVEPQQLVLFELTRIYK
ncbi:helix-turn-helix domain-containing protein [Candidatus Enterococcus huntleyi]|uniref:helix-turn-helix domain-containing protein n=1 Tax=Candidatus Enterococcus huntleyi TaxID=1857217 RepID=UPI001379FBDC|nr:helix-turn-helix domain-containing protein [Enterococcus sp. JM4C]